MDIPKTHVDTYLMQLFCQLSGLDASEAPDPPVIDEAEDINVDEPVPSDAVTRVPAETNTPEGC